MSELETLHEELIETLGQLAELTAQPQPDEAALGTIRYRLSRTSGARRRLVNSLCTDLEPRVSPANATTLRALRENNMALFNQSTGHVGTWSLRDIVRDWNGYCSASLAMRRAMFAQIEAEKTALYPLLRQ
jgi:hypothetical protein